MTITTCTHDEFAMTDEEFTEAAGSGTVEAGVEALAAETFAALGIAEAMRLARRRLA